MSPSNWDKVLEDVGLVTPAPKPVIEPVAEQFVEQIAVPVPAPAIKAAPRRAPSFGSGILDDEPFVATAPEPLRAPEPTPTPDLVADIEVTAAKSSSFFDMLPSLNPFSAFGKKPAVAEKNKDDDAPLPKRLFTPPPQKVPQNQPPQKTQQQPQQKPHPMPAVAKALTPPPVSRREEPKREEPRREQSQREERKEERRERPERSERAERSERPERLARSVRERHSECRAARVAATSGDDPWTDVATQISGVVASRRRSERPERKERPERTERVDRAECTPRAEHADRVPVTNPPRQRSESQRAESPRSEDRFGQGLSWKDAVSVVVAANVTRRRKR